MVGADFAGAYFKGATLRFADHAGVDFSEAKNFTVEQLGAGGGGAPPRGMPPRPPCPPEPPHRH